MLTWIYFTTLGLILGTILLVFGMKYYADARHAQSRIQAENAYRDLAEKAVAAQAENAAALAQIAARLAAIEKILKAVE